MKNSVFILGANGRFGRATAIAFANNGWEVTAVVRKGSIPSDGGNLTFVEADAENPAELAAACKGASVIVNALNPPYHKWAQLLPELTKSVLQAARVTGATVLIPGNVYNFGRDLPPTLSASTPQKSDGKGALRINFENEFRAATDVQTIILRGGDFLEKEKTGGWFDSVIAAKVDKGRITYPGPTDVPHAWAYLPDMARTAVALCEMRDRLDRFNDIPFAGYTLTGDELIASVNKATKTELKKSYFPWPAIWIVSLFSPLIREVRAMRYLWNKPHGLDGSVASALLPDFQPTPVDKAMKQIFS